MAIRSLFRLLVLALAAGWVSPGRTAQAAYMDAVYWVKDDGSLRVNATVYVDIDDRWPVGRIKTFPGGYDVTAPPGWVSHDALFGVEWGALYDPIWQGEQLSGFMWTTDGLPNGYRYELDPDGDVGHFVPTLIPEPPWTTALALTAMGLLAWGRRCMR